MVDCPSVDRLDAGCQAERKRDESAQSSSLSPVEVDPSGDLRRVAEELRQERDRVVQITAVQQAVRRIDKALVRETDPACLAQVVCDILVNAGTCSTAWVGLRDRTGHLRMAGSAGQTAALTRLGDLLDTGRLTPCLQAAMDETKTFVCADAMVPQSECPVRWALEGALVLVAAVTHAGRCYGTLSIAAEPGFLSEEAHVDLLQELADDVGLALHNLEISAALSDRLAEERRYRKLLQSLMHVRDVLGGTTSVDELCRQAVELGHRDLGFQQISIWLGLPDLHGETGTEPGELRLEGTFSVDAAGQVRDCHDQHTVFSSDWVRRLLEAAQSACVTHMEGRYAFDEARQVVVEDARTLAAICDGSELIGVMSVATSPQGTPLTSCAEEVLLHYATTFGDLLLRRRTEATLRDREQHCRALFETTGTATLIAGSDGVIQLANDKASQMLGLSDGVIAERVLAWDIFVPGDVERVRGYHTLSTKDPSSAPKSCEARLVDASGETRDVVVRLGMASPGQHTVVSIQDVTAHRRASERAQQRAARQSALAAIVTDATTSEDLDTLLNTALARATSALGVGLGMCWVPGHSARMGLSPRLETQIRREQLSGGLDLDCQAVEDWTTVSGTYLEPAAEHFLAAGVRASLVMSVTDEVVDRYSGGLVVASPHPRAWTAEDLAFVETVVRQLAAALRGERLRAQVRQQVQRLQVVIDSLPEGIVLLDVDRRIVLVNVSASRHLELLAGAGVGDRLDRLGTVSLEALVGEAGHATGHEITDGDTVFEVAVHPLIDSDRLEGQLLVLRDITESRLAEQQLARQSRLAAVGRLAAGIAHDFNNIVSIIVLYSQLASLDPGVSPKTRDRLNVIHKQSYRATDLIEQILDFSRTARLDMQPLDLLLLVKELVKIWQRTLPENIRFDLVYEQASCSVKADPTRLQQALMNIATNACDAMPEGGAFLIEMNAMMFGAADVPLVGMQPGNWIRLRCSDTGTGIPPELMSQVFEPFFTTKEPGKGTGLGLAQLYGIVKQHGGEVMLDSVVGQGTTVTLYLPAIAGSADCDDVRQPADSYPLGHRETVLVAEDNHATRGALVDVLTELNYQVLEASTGTEALALLSARHGRIAAVLSDAVMPKMGAVGLMSAMVDHGYTEPVIVISGYADIVELAELRANPNFVEWLAKPVDATVLAASLRALTKSPDRFPNN